MKRLLLTLAACVLAAACNRGENKEGPPPVPPTPPAAPAAPAAPVEGMAKLDGNAILERIKVLSSDEYEGRKPGTKGEELTVRYLIEESKKLGLKPGNPDGTYVQKVPLVGMQSAEAQPFTEGNVQVGRRCGAVDEAGDAHRVHQQFRHGVCGLRRDRA